MAGEEYVIREKKKYKYGEKWDLRSTRDWMAETQRALTAEISRVSGDYTVYGTDEEFAELETVIANCVFGKEVALQAYLDPKRSLRRFYDYECRIVTEMRKKMQELSDGSRVEMQVVPIFTRMDEDIGKDNNNTEQIFVFRVKNGNNAKFIDCSQRTYDTWEDYLEDNKAPQCIMCYPQNGFLRVKKHDGHFEPSGVEFCEPPSCTSGQQLLATVDVVVGVSSDEIQKSHNQITSLEQKAVDNQQKYLDNKMMQDEGAKTKYDEFAKHSINNPEGNAKIDRYGRVTQAVTYMDKEKVFQISAMTDSKIVFVNEETLDLLINNELQIHPKAVDQLLIIMDPGPNAKSDLRKVMELTQHASKEGGYLKNIRFVLKEYEMITRTEIEEAKKLINSQYRNIPEGELRSRLDSLTLAEAYRMRTVLWDAPKDCLQLAAKMAERYRDTSIHTLAAFVEIVKKTNSDAKKRRKGWPNTGAMSIEDWSDFYKTRQHKEIAGMIRDGVEKSVAEQKAAEHFTKLMNSKEAELNFRRMMEARKQDPSGVSAEELEAATTRMYIAKKDIDIKEKSFYIQFHDQSASEWLQERNTGTITINYISELLENEKAFNSKWAEITEGVTEAEKWLKQDLAFHNSVAAYYHLLKHGDDTRHYSNALNGESKHADQNADLYFNTMKNYIFGAKIRNYTVISQDGQGISTKYCNLNGYLGVTKCIYNVHLGRQIGAPSVATHFPNKKADIIKKKLQATQNQQSNTNQ